MSSKAALIAAARQMVIGISHDLEMAKLHHDLDKDHIDTLTMQLRSAEDDLREMLRNNMRLVERK